MLQILIFSKHSNLKYLGGVKVLGVVSHSLHLNGYSPQWRVANRSDSVSAAQFPFTRTKSILKISFDLNHELIMYTMNNKFYQKRMHLLTIPLAVLFTIPL